MKLSHNTMATGAVYYHRFYMFHSFQDFNRYVVSTCCLFLAGKAEETPKKCRDIGECDNVCLKRFLERVLIIGLNSSESRQAAYK